MSTAAPKIRKAPYVFAAKAYFILTGYVIYVGLARLLSPEEFGIYGVVMGLVSVVNMMIIGGTVQTVSKLVSIDGKVRPVVRSARRIQMGVGGLAAAVFFFGAEHIALFFNDPSLAPYFRVVGFVMLFYAFYAVNIGALNGLALFKEQGLFDILFGTLKAGLTLLFVWAGWGVLGAIGAFPLAAFIVMVLSGFILVRHMEPQAPEAFVPWTSIAHLQLILMAFACVSNFIMNADLFWVKRIGGDAASYNAGLYTASLTLARIPFMVLVSLNLVLFPLISNAVHSDDRQALLKMIRNGTRICFGFSLPLVCLLAANSQDALAFVYPARYAQAERALAPLAFGYGFYTLFVMLATVLTASGRPGWSLGIAAAVLAVQSALAFLWVGPYGIEGAAWATATASLVGMVLSTSLVRIRFGSWEYLAPSNLLRIAVSCGALYAAARLVHTSGFALIAEGAALLALYAVFLYLVKELCFKIN